MPQHISRILSTTNTGALKRSATTDYMPTQTMRRGPKGQVDPSPIALRRSGSRSNQFERFCRKYLTVPKGHGQGNPFELRSWQRDLIASVVDADPQPRIAGWMCPRGQGKSTLLAALGLWELFCGGEGATVVVVAVDQRQAGLIFGIARRMVELSPELQKRCQIWKERLVIPSRNATFECLPAEPKRLEGLDYSLALLDEAGEVDRATYEVLALAQGKRPRSSLIAIGTPGPDPDSSVLVTLRNLHAELGPEYIAWSEFSANEFQHHSADCRHCWELANPALGDFLAEDAMVTLLKTMSENTFRRVRLCQVVTDTTGQFLPPGTWDGLSTGKPIPKGSKVVIGLDGSLSNDSTALVIGTVSATPHFDLLGLWERPQDDDDWRVSIAEVEDVIRRARKEYRVVELVADPWGWSRTLQTLEAEGFTVASFPWNASRLTAATTDLYVGCTNGTMSHSGNPDLARHVGNAVVKRDSRGLRITKSCNHGPKIDAAAALLMAHSRATWHGTRQPRNRYASFKH